MTYKLELPSTSRVDPIFLVSCLKKVIGDKILIQTILPKFDEERKNILQPVKITETRTKQLQTRAITDYLIKWKNLSMEDSTWENESFIRKHPQLTKH
jgi:hypothetical protein